MVAVALMLAAPAIPARAALREVSVGNYYFQDDASGNRAQIVVDRGDQVRFTIREAAFSPHDVRVDELGIRSGDMQLFETFTTEPLDVVGTFRLYCNRHKDNPGQPHVAQLVVRSERARLDRAPDDRAPDRDDAPAFRRRHDRRPGVDDDSGRGRHPAVG